MREQGKANDKKIVEIPNSRKVKIKCEKSEIRDDKKYKKLHREIEVLAHVSRPTTESTKGRTRSYNGRLHGTTAVIMGRR